MSRLLEVLGPMPTPGTTRELTKMVGEGGDKLAHHARDLVKDPTAGEAAVAMLPGGGFAVAGRRLYRKLKGTKMKIRMSGISRALLCNLMESIGPMMTPGMAGEVGKVAGKIGGKIAGGAKALYDRGKNKLTGAAGAVGKAGKNVVRRGKIFTDRTVPRALSAGDPGFKYGLGAGTAYGAYKMARGSMEESNRISRSVMNRLIESSPKSIVQMAKDGYNRPMCGNLRSSINPAAKSAGISFAKEAKKLRKNYTGMFNE